MSHVQFVRSCTLNTGRRTVRLRAIVGIALLVALCGAPASAAPADEPLHDTATVQVNATYSISANAAAQQISIPIANGLTPGTLTAVATPDNSLTGRIEVIVGGNVTQRVVVDGTGQALSLTIDMTGAYVNDNAAEVSIRYLTDDVRDDQGVCLLSNLGSIALSDLQLSTTGVAQQPQTVADFFDTSVTAVSVIAADPTDADVRQASLTAAAALRHKYGSTSAVSVTSADDSSRAVVTSTAGGRIVMIERSDGETSTTLGANDAGVSVLTISGSGDDLTAAARALGDDRLALAGGTAVTGAASGAASATAVTQRTFADLGSASPTLEGVGQSTFSLGVSQADYLQPMSEFTVHLAGAHTAIPSGVQAMLTVTWNDQIIDSFSLSEPSTFSRDIDVPESQVKSGNGLKVELDAALTGVDGTENTAAQCGTGSTILPVRVTIDGTASTVSGTPGQSLDKGFSRFPQVLSGQLPIAFGDDSAVDADTLTDAAAVVIALQGASSQLLDVQQQTAEQLIASGASGVLIAASSDQMDELQAPLRLGQFRSIDQANGTFATGVDAPFAVLEGFTTGDREVLALADWQPDGNATDGTTGSELRHHLADSILTNPNGWSALYDDLYVAQSTTAEPKLVDSNSIVPQSSRVASFSGFVWWGVAVLGALVVLLLIGMFTRARTRAKARRIVDAESAVDSELSMASRRGRHYGDADPR